MGCQFSTLFESTQHSGDTFFNRAKTLLGLSIFDVGTLRVVQALLLMGSYLQSTSRPNQCWNVLGMGIRVAQGLGLHIEPSEGDFIERESRRRVWWGCVLMDRYIPFLFPLCRLPLPHSFVLTGRVLAMLFGRPLMIHDRDAYMVALPVLQDDITITPTALLPSKLPSKMTFYICTCQLYWIMGDILRELYSPQDDYKTMTEQQWVAKVSLILRFDKEINDWLGTVPRFLQWGTGMEVSEDIERQRNVLRARFATSNYLTNRRTLNVRNLLYRPSLIFLSQSDYARQQGLDLSMTMTCARFCVVSAKKTIQLLHSTDPRLTGPFWYNIFCTTQL